jgi:hypothetical protein
MADIWMGDSSYGKAIREGALTPVSNRALMGSITSWMVSSIFSDLSEASGI